jgi:hypothetical protein
MGWAFRSNAQRGSRLLEALAELRLMRVSTTAQAMVLMRITHFVYPMPFAHHLVQCTFRKGMGSLASSLMPLHVNDMGLGLLFRNYKISMPTWLSGDFLHFHPRVLARGGFFTSSQHLPQATIIRLF